MFAAKNLVVFSTFDIKVQLFCFLLKQCFENVKKKSLRSGFFREGRSSSCKHNIFFRWRAMLFDCKPSCKSLCDLISSDIGKLEFEYIFIPCPQCLLLGKTFKLCNITFTYVGNCHSLFGIASTVQMINPSCHYNNLRITFYNSWCVMCNLDSSHPLLLILYYAK